MKFMEMRYATLEQSASLHYYGCIGMEIGVDIGRKYTYSGADTGFLKGGGTVYETLPEAVHRGA